MPLAVAALSTIYVNHVFTKYWKGGCTMNKILDKVKATMQMQIVNPLLSPPPLMAGES